MSGKTDDFPAALYIYFLPTSTPPQQFLCSDFHGSVLVINHGAFEMALSMPFCSLCIMLTLESQALPQLCAIPADSVPTLSSW